MRIEESASSPACWQRPTRGPRRPSSWRCCGGGARPFRIDTNVIVDVLSRAPVWFDWSASALERCAREGPLAVNPIIFAELAVGLPRIEDLAAALPQPDGQRVPLPWTAGFLARRCFGEYRRRGGNKSSPLPDFYIGAHAAVEDLTVVTRNAGRFRTCFPKVRLIEPGGGAAP